MTKQKQLIRGVYPTDGGRIALRTDENWDSNIEAGSAGRTGVCPRVSDRNRAAIFLLQACPDSHNATLWSRGENFREDTRCSICELMPPLASRSGAPHRFRVFVPPGYYENALKKYPVLCMHHGHNLFFKEEAFVGFLL
jgi:hypothetical protein